MSHELDLGKEKPSDKISEPEKKLWHPDKAKMTLAYSVLTAIAFIFIICVICSFLAYKNYFDENFADGLFEMFKTGLLPMVTFILGYYFSKE